jgi:hypothetical protein
LNPFTGRLLGYICLSLFLAFVAGPYTAEKEVSKTEPAVYLSAVALSNSAQRAACSEGLKSVSEEDLKPFPKIKKAVSFLSHSLLETNQVSLYGGNLEAFIKRKLGRSQRAFCFEYGGKTFKLVWLIIRDMGTLYLVGLNEPPPVPSLAESKLSEYPGMAFYFKNLEETAPLVKDPEPKNEAVPPSSRSGENLKIIDDAMRRFKQIQRQVERQSMVHSAVKRGVFYKKERTALGWDEWVSLNRALGTREENAVFRIGDYLIIGASETLTENVTINIGWFRVGRYLFAAVFLGFGLFSMRGAYRKRPGINLNPGWTAIIGDGIFILFIGFGAYCLVEYLMGKCFGMTSFLGDEAVLGICSIGYLPVAAFCALFSANQFSQSVEVAEDGLILHYPGGATVLTWEDIQGFDLKDSHTVVGRGGTMIPRKVQTKLTIKTADGISSLVEPGFKATKRKLIRTIMDKAPERLQSDLEKVSEVW